MHNPLSEIRSTIFINYVLFSMCTLSGFTSFNTVIISSSKMHVWMCVAKPMSRASCSWWWLCYMSKHMCGQVLVLPSWHLVHPAADDKFTSLSILVCKSISETVRVKQTLHHEMHVHPIWISTSILFKTASSEEVSREEKKNNSHQPE